ncbi:hypothetical protein [Herbidospora sp. RD11066]
MPVEIIRLPADLDEAIAVAAVLTWRGVSGFEPADPAQAEAIAQAVAMTEAIAGRRPPALARRGLA